MHMSMLHCVTDTNKRVLYPMWDLAPSKDERAYCKHTCCLKVIWMTCPLFKSCRNWKAKIMQPCRFYNSRSHRLLTLSNWKMLAGIRNKNKTRDGMTTSNFLWIASILQLLCLFCRHFRQCELPKLTCSTRVSTSVCVCTHLLSPAVGQNINKKDSRAPAV